MRSNIVAWLQRRRYVSVVGLNAPSCVSRRLRWLVRVTQLPLITHFEMIDT